MEVVCIKDSVPIDKNEPRIILVKKGSRYHVINVVEAPLFGLPTAIWYELLETKECLHNHALFAIAPPIIDEQEKIEQYEIRENTLS